MSYDEKTDRMDWKDEFDWIGISLISGLLLAFIFFYFDRFPDASHITVIAICCAGFYLLSILIRIQNHRGKLLTGETAANEKKLKFIFPVLGFALGLALIFLSP